MFLYISDFARTLISVGKLSLDMNCDLIFSSSSCTLQDRISRRVFGAGEMRKGPYWLKYAKSTLAFRVVKTKSYHVWHQRSGHPTQREMSLIPEITMHKAAEHVCDGCPRAKQSRAPFPESYNNAMNCFDLVHCDV